MSGALQEAKTFLLGYQWKKEHGYLLNRMIELETSTTERFTSAEQSTKEARHATAASLVRVDESLKAVEGNVDELSKTVEQLEHDQQRNARDAMTEIGKLATLVQSLESSRHKTEQDVRQTSNICHGQSHSIEELRRTIEQQKTENRHLYVSVQQALLYGPRVHKTDERYGLTPHRLAIAVRYGSSHQDP